MTRENKLFYYGLLLSFFIHCLALSYFSYQRKDQLKKTFKSIEVSYSVIKNPRQAPVMAVQPIESKMIHKADLPKDIKTTPEKLDPFLEMKNMNRASSRLPGDYKMGKKQMPGMESFSSNRKITVPLLKAEKITNANYLSYNQSIREKIREKAYQYVNHPDFANGEVYLTFVLQSNGILKATKVIEGKTSANVYLKEIGLKSIEESSPFAPFPKELNFPELTFNVIISFESNP